ncbi:MAG: GNAT family N-acetyltransferase [Pirellulaceae bacterium]|nr:GNAT family N-acetyltransferase [Pirellulaceae bacterium]
MPDIFLRPMRPADRSEVSDLIRVSTNAWYQARGNGPIFAEGPEVATVFFDLYEAIDPGCGIVAEDRASGRLAGSCFYHPRATHVSLGIMNVHPDHFERGVARALLQHVIDFADADEKPLRLVSSAVNLDSFSLYNRAGFVPRAVYQDMVVRIPESGIDTTPAGKFPLREGRSGDAHAMALLEMDLAGIMREKDFAHILENRDGFWHVTLCPNGNGRLDGFMASSRHPGCNMIGPGVARNEEVAEALILAELDRHRGRSPVMLVPVGCRSLVGRLYQWGARNCELHFAQARGHWHEPEGIVMPTFLPESA